LHATPNGAQRIHTYGLSAAGGTLYLLDQNGYVCRFGEGDSYGGRRIEAYWKTPMTDLDAKAVNKRLEELLPARQRRNSLSGSGDRRAERYTTSG
jgi:hypothetical protein